jgi:hypothetical protein
MEWFSFLSDLSNTLEPFVILIIFSIGLCYFSKKQKHLLSRVSFLETVIGFLIVIITIILYKTNFVTYENYYLFTFFSAVGILWGTQGLIWGFIFYFIPIEKILKIEAKKRIRKRLYIHNRSNLRYPRIQ